MREVRQSTEAQQRAVRYCERWLGIKFTADINNFSHCSRFLDKNLPKAKRRANYIINKRKNFDDQYRSVIGARKKKKG